MRLRRPQPGYVRGHARISPESLDQRECGMSDECQRLWDAVLDALQSKQRLSFLSSPSRELTVAAERNT